MNLKNVLTLTVVVLLIAFGGFTVSNRVFQHSFLWSLWVLFTAMLARRYGVMHQIVPGYVPKANGHFLWDVGAKITAIRNGALRELTAAKGGLVSIPSFHAITAVLFTWAASAIRLVWIPILLLNIAMLFCALVSGGHYLIDLIVGLAPPLPPGGLQAEAKMTTKPTAKFGNIASILRTCSSPYLFYGDGLFNPNVTPNPASSTPGPASVTASIPAPNATSASAPGEENWRTLE